MSKSSKRKKHRDTDHLQQRHDLADQLLLATKWMVESRPKLGDAIADRFKAIIELRENWEDSLFEFGRFMEYRYHEAKGKETETMSGSGKPTISSSSTGGGAHSSRSSSKASVHTQQMNIT